MILLPVIAGLLRNMLQIVCQCVNGNGISELCNCMTSEVCYRVTEGNSECYPWLHWVTVLALQNGSAIMGLDCIVWAMQ